MPSGEIPKFNCLSTRREFLWRFGGGLGGVALAHLLGHQDFQLIKRSGEKFDPGQRVESATSAPGNLMKSPYEWKQHG
jgi:hypothetical protein